MSVYQCSNRINAHQSLIITFPPTRSLVLDVRQDGISLGPAGDRWAASGLTVLISGSESNISPYEVFLSGEKHKKPIEEIMNHSFSFLVRPPPQGLMREWHAGRELLARLSLAHRFFFELDREFMDAALAYRVTLGEISENERVHRLALVNDVTCLLMNRLSARQTKRQSSDLPKAPLHTARHIELCSTYFYDSATKLVSSNGIPPDWHLFGHACSLFAAGEMRSSVVVGTSPSNADNWGVTEPDSANILMFAELAFVSLDLGLHSEMWTILLPYLVRMQWYYWSRVCKPNEKRDFDKYGEPSEARVPSNDRLRINRRIPVDPSPSGRPPSSVPGAMRVG